MPTFNVKIMKKYYPVLVSKPGEIVALQHLTQNVKNQICPVIEVLKTNSDTLTKFLLLHWIFFENAVVLDFTYYKDAEDNIEEIKKLIELLLSRKVNVIPAIQVNSPTCYCEIITELLKTQISNICVRTCNGSGGFDKCNTGINELLKSVNIKSENTILLFDIGYSKKEDYNILSDILTTALKTVINNKWLDLVICSSSFPADLGEIKPAHQLHTIPRFEWKIWQTVSNKDEFKGRIKYGDFGTKYPIFIDAGFAGTISVKYSTADNFIIYKGELTTEHKDGHGQYITHAKKLVASTDFYGNSFSWGDLQIYQISGQIISNTKRKTGSPQTWVQYSQNHHITMISSLL
jgi:hypothetical protein